MAGLNIRVGGRTGSQPVPVWRGPGPGRPRLPLPPDRMPLFYRGRPVKRWRYIGFYGDDVMLCLAVARVGLMDQSFWSVWDRQTGAVYGHTDLVPGRSTVTMAGRLARIDAPRQGIRASLLLGDSEPIEVIGPNGRGWAWTRKQAGVPITGQIEIDGRQLRLDGLGVDDQSAGYHARHTAWLWSAGIGMAADGRPVAWNLVSGINDPETGSERAIWVDGEPMEPSPVTFDGLDAVRFGPAAGEPAGPVGERPALLFTPGPAAERRRDDNFLLIRSRYVHRFGTFTGRLGELELESGAGVMEDHRVAW